MIFNDTDMIIVTGSAGNMRTERCFVAKLV